jgi:hypothetical protein
MLVWETACERNNLGFHVWRAERASESWGLRLTSAPIAGAGTCSSPRSYSYVDTDVLGGITYYYRLEQLDLDGTSTCYGPVVTAFPGQPALQLGRPVPQPAVSHVLVTCSLPAAGTYSVCFFNTRGEVVHAYRNTAPSAGTYTIPFQCGRWSPGVYVLTLRCEAGTVSERLVVSSD